MIVVYRMAVISLSRDDLFLRIISCDYAARMSCESFGYRVWDDGISLYITPQMHSRALEARWSNALLATEYQVSVNRKRVWRMRSGVDGQVSRNIGTAILLKPQDLSSRRSHKIKRAL